VVGLAVLILAGAAAYAIDSKDVVLSDATVALLSTALGAIIGALGAYLGLHRHEELDPPHEGDDYAKS
jgi:heme A synthase